MTVKLPNRLAQSLRRLFTQFNKPTYLDNSEPETTPLGANHPLVIATELHNNELDRRRNQLWIGLWIVTALVLVVTFMARRTAGEPVNPLSILIQVALYGLVLANFIFMKSGYAQFTQGLYVLCIHLAAPPVLVLYGGTRGFGDIALFAAVIVSMLYGWRGWMLVTFGVMSITLIWVVYRDSMGQPVAPLLDYSAREEERRRLRRDLHDGLGPTLAAQMFRIGVARSVLEKAPDKTAVMLNDLERDIDQTLNDVRRLVYGLRPPLLDQLGLRGAISDFVRQQRERISINLSLPDQLPSLNAAVEVAIYRIFQTALDNVIKHASATNCAICLPCEGDELILTIEDDGVGLPEDVAEGVGLTSMRERAEELGGTFHVVSRCPQGTCLRVTFPLLGEAFSKEGN